MIPPLDATTQLYLSDIGRISDRMERAQRQLATGKRMNSVSDDPGSVTPLLETRSALGAVQQINMNLGRVKTEVDGATNGLQAAVTIMERVQVLGSQGVTDTATADSRQVIAGELGSLLEQLGGIARTNVEGRYVFSGDSDQTTPYNIDLTQADPIGTYAGSAATREVEHPNGTRFSVALTAQTIFDAADPTQNVFHSVNDLRVAMQANDAAGIQTALAKVMTAGAHLNRQLAVYGTAQNKVADAIDYGSKMALQLQGEASTYEDADMTSAIVEFQSAQTQQQAALMIHSKMPRSSLFDYLG